MIRQIEKYEDLVEDIYNELERLKTDVYSLSIDSDNEFTLDTEPGQALWDQSYVVNAQADAVYDSLVDTGRYVDDWLDDLRELKKIVKKHRR